MGLTDRVASRYKEAATEIDVEDLPAEYRKWVRDLGYTPVTAHRGMNGYIIVTEPQGSSPAGRYPKEFLAKLVKNPKFRWLEKSPHTGTIDFGMDG